MNEPIGCTTPEERASAWFSRTTTGAGIAPGEGNAIPINREFARTPSFRQGAHGFPTASTISVPPANRPTGRGAISMSQGMDLDSSARFGEGVRVTGAKVVRDRARVTPKTVRAVGDRVAVAGGMRVKARSKAARGAANPR